METDMKISEKIEGHMVVGASSFAKYVTAEFHAKEDITAYELAQLLPPMWSCKPFTEYDWEKLGSLQRHFKRLS